MIKNRIRCKEKIQNYLEINIEKNNKYKNFTHVFKNSLDLYESQNCKHYFTKNIKINNTNINFMIKMIPFIKNTLYSDNLDDPMRPENSEIEVSKILSEFVVSGQTPHVILSYFSFISDINTFTDPKMIDIIGTDKNYIFFIDNYNEGKFYETVKILVTEKCFDKYKNLEELLFNENENFTLLNWKIMLFQILSALAVIQNKYPSFKHNNLKTQNIRLTKNNKKKSNKLNKYDVNGISFNVPNIEYLFLISDFGMSSIKGIVDNLKLSTKPYKNIGINDTENKYYDVYYFLSYIAFICYLKKIFVPPEIENFIDRNIPDIYKQKKINKYSPIIEYLLKKNLQHHKKF
jgi:hypothetical protein